MPGAAIAAPGWLGRGGETTSTSSETIGKPRCASMLTNVDLPEPDSPWKAKHLPDAVEGIEAHAWLTLEGRVLVGGNAITVGDFQQFLIADRRRPNQSGDVSEPLTPDP